mmetsp:Transcript_41588/g.98606  ORF Transcript_41588/g.98606 Transcript_41588/m.98606 type:complete len:655 (+) Transcript_41588:3941-5905(+)
MHGAHAEGPPVVGLPVRRVEHGQQLLKLPVNFAREVAQLPVASKGQGEVRREVGAVDVPEVGAVHGGRAPAAELARVLLDSLLVDGRGGRERVRHHALHFDAVGRLALVLRVHDRELHVPAARHILVALEGQVERQRPSRLRPRAVGHGGHVVLVGDGELRSVGVLEHLVVLAFQARDGHAGVAARVHVARRRERDSEHVAVARERRLLRDACHVEGDRVDLEGLRVAEAQPDGLRVHDARGRDGHPRHAGRHRGVLRQVELDLELLARERVLHHVHDKRALRGVPRHVLVPQGPGGLLRLEEGQEALLHVRRAREARDGDVGAAPREQRHAGAHGHDDLDGGARRRGHGAVARALGRRGLDHHVAQEPSIVVLRRGAPRRLVHLFHRAPREGDIVQHVAHARVVHLRGGGVATKVVHAHVADGHHAARERNGEALAPVGQRGVAEHEGEGEGRRRVGEVLQANAQLAFIGVPVRQHRAARDTVRDVHHVRHHGLEAIQARDRDLGHARREQRRVAHQRDRQGVEVTRPRAALADALDGERGGDDPIGVHALRVRRPAHLRAREDSLARRRDGHRCGLDLHRRVAQLERKGHDRGRLDVGLHHQDKLAAHLAPGAVLPERVGVGGHRHDRQLGRVVRVGADQPGDRHGEVARAE